MVCGLLVGFGFMVRMGVLFVDVALRLVLLIVLFLFFCLSLYVFVVLWFVCSFVLVVM